MIKVFNKTTNNGVGIYLINRVMIALISVITVLIFIFTSELDKKYEELTEAQKSYISCDKNANDLYNSSVNLIRCVQYLVHTGDIDYIYAYFDEVDSRRKENAIIRLNVSNIESEAFNKAMEGYEQLMGLDYHIMKLVAVANNFDMEKLPIKVSSYSLNKYELEADRETKLDMARDIIYGSKYAFMKNKIDANLGLFSSQKLSDMEDNVSKLTNDVKLVLIQLEILIAVLVFAIIAVGFIYYTQIISVINSFVSNIKKNEPLQRKGASEMQYLALTYNENKRQIDEREQMLKYRASHDDLTGLVGRNAFESYVESRLNTYSDTYRALILVDVDNFKVFNDNYGHDMGDLILKNIADMLSSICDKNDLAGRIGGDEFVIWLEGDDKNNNYIIDHINNINKSLLIPTKIRPSMSISAGCVFAKENDSYLDMYRNADKVLYEAKGYGKCKCIIAS